MKDDLYYDPEDYEERGVCSYCGNTCSVVVVDMGIGPYHYGSEIDTDIQEVKLSNCCKAFLKEKTNAC